MPASTITPMTIGSRELNTQLGRIWKRDRCVILITFPFYEAQCQRFFFFAEQFSLIIIKPAAKNKRRTKIGRKWIKNQLIKRKRSKKLVTAQEMILPVRERTNRAASYSFHQWIHVQQQLCCVFSSVLASHEQTNKRDSFMKIVQMTLTRIFSKAQHTNRFFSRLWRSDSHFDSVSATVQRQLRQIIHHLRETNKNFVSRLIKVN